MRGVYRSWYMQRVRVQRSCFTSIVAGHKPMRQGTNPRLTFPDFNQTEANVRLEFFAAHEPSLIAECSAFKREYIAPED